MARTFKEDYAVGTLSEQTIKPTLDKFFGTCHKLHEKHTMDFEANTFFIEVKTRTCASTTYETSVLPYFKVEFAQKVTKPVYFVFVFTDGIFYTQYNADKFSYYYVEENYCRKRRADYNDKPKPYIHIPVAELTKIEL
jgi:hypothetical protein